MGNCIPKKKQKEHHERRRKPASPVAKRSHVSLQRETRCTKATPAVITQTHETNTVFLQEKIKQKNENMVQHRQVFELIVDAGSSKKADLPYEPTPSNRPKNPWIISSSRDIANSASSAGTMAIQSVGCDSRVAKKLQSDKEGKTDQCGQIEEIKVSNVAHLKTTNGTSKIEIVENSLLSPAERTSQDDIKLEEVVEELLASPLQRAQPQAAKDTVHPICSDDEIDVDVVVEELLNHARGSPASHNHQYLAKQPEPGNGKEEQGNVFSSNQAAGKVNMHGKTKKCVHFKEVVDIRLISPRGFHSVVIDNSLTEQHKVCGESVPGTTFTEEEVDMMRDIEDQHAVKNEAKKVSEVVFDEEELRLIEEIEQNYGC